MFNIQNKTYIPVILASLVIAIATNLSIAQNLIKYTPSTTPLLKIATPKPNIYMLLDDSGSMYGSEAYMAVKEHFYGPGDPVCEKRVGTAAKEWNDLVDKYKKLGEEEGVNYYNPFQSGSYVPYLVSKNGESGLKEEEYNKYIGSIPIERCYSKVYRTEAVIQMTPEILEKYSKRAYLGYGGFGKESLPRFKSAYYAEGYETTLAKLRKHFFETGQWDITAASAIATKDVESDINYNVFVRTIMDMEAHTPDDWEKIKLSIARDIMGEYLENGKKFMLGNTPTFNAVYNVSLYFRGYPIVKRGHSTPSYGTEFVTPPKRYRCTTNSVIVLTDGDSNDTTLGLIAKADLSENGGFLSMSGNIAAYERSSEGTFHFQSPHAGYQITSSAARKALNSAIGREFTKASMRDGTYQEKDAAGVKWGSDKFSIPQKLQVNAVQYGIEKFNGYLQALTDETGGQMITLPEDASSTAILNAMDAIMSDLVRSTSNAQVAVNQFKKTDYSIRYTFKYNIDSRRGEVIAHKADKNSDTGWAEFDDDGNPKSLWRSETSIPPASGRFITMDYTNTPKPALIGWDSIKSSYGKGTDKSYLHNNHIGWLRGEIIIDNINLPSENRVYKKLSPMGPIINSEVALFKHDVEYINLKNMGGTVKEEFNQYVLYKNKTLKRDYMIINSNDGMVNFLSIPRSSPNIEKELASGTKSVERVAAYFPGILTYRLPELSGLNAVGYSIDGMIRLFEFKDSNGDYRSIGLSGFGAGGRGLVGYQLFKATPDSSRSDKFKNPDTEIKPLFEISNELKWSTYGNNKNFGNLGYAFSDFGFFNQSHPDSTGNGRGVAVFGNGYGENKSGESPSSLYFIDVETGALIKEIILNDNGGGASSPALIVERSGDYSTLKKIYVGDVSGQLYSITFTSDDLSHNPIEVLYKPLSEKYNPITVKPLVVLSEGDEWVYFGTGRKSDEVLDRGKSSPSKDTQYIIALKNPQPIEEPLTINNLHQNRVVLSKKIEIGPEPDKKTLQTITTESVDSGEEKIQLGWYLALTKENNLSDATTSGERVVFSPKQSYGDVLFSTWGLDEYDTSGGDPCVEDYVYGKFLILDKKTGLLGTGNISGEKVGGFIVKENAPGISAGDALTESVTSGESYGGSTTLAKETVKELNKASDSSHTVGDKKVCIGNVADDYPNVYDFTVKCPPQTVYTSRGVSIRKRL